MERFEKKGEFLVHDGQAKERGLRSTCRNKVCFHTSSLPALLDLLFEMSRSADCYEVKAGTNSRDGVFSGWCHFTNDASVGDAWARYAEHPKIWATVHNDDFADTFRSRIRKYQSF